MNVRRCKPPAYVAWLVLGLLYGVDADKGKRKRSRFCFSLSRCILFHLALLVGESVVTSHPLTLEVAGNYGYHAVCTVLKIVIKKKQNTNILIIWLKILLLVEFNSRIKSH